MNICVFCSSSNGIDQEYFDEAANLAEIMTANKHNLIYGGANVGLMNHLAIKMSNKNGNITGVIPRKIHERKLGAKEANQLIITETMHERKDKMNKLSDAFIALPGGFGTLEEILEIITLKQLDYHQKPICIINTKGFYNPLIQQFESSFSENFSQLYYKTLYKVVNSASEAISYIENYETEKDNTNWHIVPNK